MISARPWELTAALSVLEHAQQYAAALRDSASDLQTLEVAELRCRLARCIVERIRTTLDGNSSNRHLERAQGEFHG